MVTMSKFAKGVAPEEALGCEWTWITDESAVKAIGSFLSEFRHRSMLFEVEHPADAAKFPAWDEIQGGWQTLFGPMDIPVNADTFGIIHSDLHTSNFMLDLQTDGSWDIFAIDFDNAQRSWYIIDLGTIVFEANRQLDTARLAGKTSQEYQDMAIDQFKTWITSTYNFPVTAAELTEACEWRKDFEYWLRVNDLNTLPPTDPQYQFSQVYVDYYDSGKMPSC